MGTSSTSTAEIVLKYALLELLKLFLSLLLLLLLKPILMLLIVVL